jgi:hypothetical protein
MNEEFQLVGVQENICWSGKQVREYFLRNDPPLLKLMKCCAVKGIISKNQSIVLMLSSMHQTFMMELRLPLVKQIQVSCQSLKVP